MSTCIFPGRFQPFHNGHLLVVKGMMKACGRAIIVICHEPGDKAEDDLFNREQVREMISATLLDDDIVDANIVMMADCESDDEWVDKVLEEAGRPEQPVVWSGNEGVLALFEKHNVGTKKIVPVPGIVGAELRKMIKDGDGEWREKVPSGARRVINGAGFGQ